jgi:hypothetical protein
MFGKNKPEELTDGDLEVIVNHPSFEILITRVMQRLFDGDVEIRQIVVDRVNIILDDLFSKEDNIENIKRSVTRQIDELHDVKILLDRIQRDLKEENSE